jgi:3-oxoacyl-[acyl-carrier-protein] synthase-3
MNNNRYYIHGTGYYVPEKVLTNKDFESMVDTSDEWITSRTGIEERRIAAQGEASSDMALEAAKRALADAGMEASELTHIIVSTLTPDTYCPSCACWLEEKLGVKGLTALDVNAACSGFMYGLQTARAMLALDPKAKVLLVASETLSSRTNYSDRSTCVLFGDGAGAAILSSSAKDAKAEVLDIELGSDGEFAPLLTVKGGGSAYPYKPNEPVNDEFFIEMQGREVFKIATRTMEMVARQVLERNSMQNGDLDLLIPHQANVRIINHVGQRLGFPEDRIYINVNKYGNTSAASVGIALAEARENGAVKSGDNALIVTFGGGLTWGAGLIKFF